MFPHVFLFSFPRFLSFFLIWERIQRIYPYSTALNVSLNISLNWKGLGFYLNCASPSFFTFSFSFVHTFFLLFLHCLFSFFLICKRFKNMCSYSATLNASQHIPLTLVCFFLSVLAAYASVVFIFIYSATLVYTFSLNWKELGFYFSCVA